MEYSSSSWRRSSAKHWVAKYQNTAFTLMSSFTEVFINLAPKALDNSSASLLENQNFFQRFFKIT